MTDAEPERTLADIIRTGTTIEVKAASDALIAKHGRDIADRLWAEACDDVGRARAIAETLDGATAVTVVSGSTTMSSAHT